MLGNFRLPAKVRRMFVGVSDDASRINSLSLRNVMALLTVVRLQLSLLPLLMLAGCGGDALPSDPINGSSGGSSGVNGSSGGQGNNGTGGQNGSGSADNNGTGSNSNSGSGGATGGPGSGGGGNNGSTGGGNNEGSGGNGPDVDANGKENASPGDMTSTNQDYLRLGEIRILNNNWGSEDLGCANSHFSVFVNQDSSFGWTFDRGTCGGMGSKPDFPQIEFGIHPFGIGSPLATSPEFSSTTLLPIQVKDVSSASVTIEDLNVVLEKEGSYNITFEFWLSERNPVTDPNPGVYAELMTFWGWQNGRWPEDGPGMNGSADGGSGTGDKVNSDGKPYTLWVQRDIWADGWRYFQFRADDGPKKNFDGKVDVKPLIDYLVNSRGYSKDYWVTRLEVGSEIDDETKGTVTMKGVTFEINGEQRSEVIVP